MATRGAVLAGGWWEPMGQGLVPYGLPLSWPLLHLADCERRPSIGRYARLSSKAGTSTSARVASQKCCK